MRKVVWYFFLRNQARASDDKDPDKIIAAVGRGRQALNSLH
jgi:tryptophan synthase beta subunit